MTTKPDFGTYGVWRGRAVLTPDLAARIERLGYTALWIGGSPGAALDDVGAALDATESLIVATGIVNIWRADARETAASYHRLEARHPGRFVLGIGSGHREADAARARPYAALVEYLDVLDAEGVPPERRLLAALGPRTLRLSAERSLGAHPYLSPPEHTRWARGVVGPDALLAPDQKVVGETDADAARAIGRAFLRRYQGMENYAGMLERFGFDLTADGGPVADRVVDRLAAWGAPAVLAAAVRDHLEAGASHVAIQVLPVDTDPIGVLEEVRAALE